MVGMVWTNTAEPPVSFQRCSSDKAEPAAATLQRRQPIVEASKKEKRLKGA
jgi:hypothetical protein